MNRGAPNPVRRVFFDRTPVRDCREGPPDACAENSGTLQFLLQMLFLQEEQTKVETGQGFIIDTHKATRFQGLTGNAPKKRLSLAACMVIALVTAAGCGKSGGTRPHSRYSIRPNPPTPAQSAPARLAADRYLYQSEQLRIQDAGIQKTLKKDILSKNYAGADKTMEKLDRESRADPRYESLYVDTLKSITSCDHPDRPIERPLLAYESSRPDSPWPHILLGRYYDSAACHARGYTFANKVKQDQWAALQNFDRRAYSEYQQALSLNKKLFPAYDGMMRILMNLGTLRQITAVYEQSRKVLPNSYILAIIYMNALEPRWQGSYKLMHGFAQSMQKHLAENPRFYNLLGAVYADKADMAYLDHKYLHSAEEYTIALIYGDNTDWLSLAGYAASHAGLDHVAFLYFARYMFYKKSAPAIRKIMDSIKHFCAKHPKVRNCEVQIPPFLKMESYSALRASH